MGAYTSEGLVTATPKRQVASGKHAHLAVHSKHDRRPNLLPHAEHLEQHIDDAYAQTHEARARALTRKKYWCRINVDVREETHIMPA